MYKNLALNYFLENNLAKKEISTKDIFNALFEINSLFQYEIIGATKEEIDSLEMLVGMPLPKEYKEFLELAGKKLAKLKMYHWRNPIDFNIEAIINQYKTYSNKQIKKLQTLGHVEIGYIGYNSITDYPDKLNMLRIDCQSGAIFDIEGLFEYPSIQELFFYFGFLTLNCKNKIGYFTPSYTNPIRVKNLDSTIDSLYKGIIQFSQDIQYHPYSSKCFQYFTIAGEGVHLIFNFSYFTDEYVSLHIGIYITNNFQYPEKGKRTINKFLSGLKNAKFVKELGLEYHYNNNPTP